MSDLEAFGNLCNKTKQNKCVSIFISCSCCWQAIFLHRLRSSCPYYRNRRDNALKSSLTCKRNCRCFMNQSIVLILSMIDICKAFEVGRLTISVTMAILYVNYRDFSMYTIYRNKTYLKAVTISGEIFLVKNSLIFLPMHTVHRMTLRWCSSNFAVWFSKTKLCSSSLSVFLPYSLRKTGKKRTTFLFISEREGNLLNETFFSG